MVKTFNKITNVLADFFHGQLISTVVVDFFDVKINRVPPWLTSLMCVNTSSLIQRHSLVSMLKTEALVVVSCGSK